MSFQSPSEVREPFLKYDTELIESRLPVSDRHSPFFRDVSQGQIEQFEHGLVIGKLPVESHLDQVLKRKSQIKPRLLETVSRKLTDLAVFWEPKRTIFILYFSMLSSVSVLFLVRSKMSAFIVYFFTPLAA